MHYLLVSIVIFLSLFHGSISYAQPNLTPYQPTGWSDKIVVSKTTGTNTDSSPLYTTDTLYVDWAVINNGTAATAARFYNKLYVDGVERQSWYIDPPLNANYYTYVTDYSIGTLSAGTHTIKIATDTTGAISESNESDNEYTKTITVTASTLPNLTPYQPTGWSDKIVVSKTTGTNTDSSPLYTTDTLYVDWAVINNGTVATAATFYTKLYVDGVERNSWYTDPPLNVNYYTSATDYSIGTLSAGTHTIKIATDTTGVISESNETDNEYTKTITVISEGVTLKKALVLLIDFSDEPGQVPRDSFQDLLFGTKPSVAPKGSFKDYYSEVSYNKLQIEGQVNDVTISWIRLPQSSTY